MADVRRTVREWALREQISSGSLYLVALSGGGDSAALAWAASVELPKLGVRVGAVVVDHDLQEGSASVATHAADQAGAWGVSPVVVKRVVVGNSGGPEDAARTARYRAFREALAETGAVGVILGHTEDDQAETVLLGLTRGSGPASLKGMAPRDGVFHRPLLGMPRTALRQALEDAGESWWDDPHNDDPRFTRVRVRHDVMPVMERELGPGVARALARSAELFRDDCDALDAMAKALCSDAVVSPEAGHWTIPVEVLEGLPEALLSRVLKNFAEGSGARGLGYVHIREMMNLVRSWSGQAEVSLSGALVGRRGGALHARIAPSDVAKEEVHGI